jgi:hypothetical protein
LITPHEAGATYHCGYNKIFKGMDEALERLLWMAPALQVAI